MFGPDWRATVIHDGQGLHHRPVGPPRPQPRYDRATLALLCTQADDLTARLRRRYLRGPVADTERVLRCYGRAEMRWLRRQRLFRGEEG